MYCRKCGCEIPDGIYFCPHCGQKTEEPQNTYSGEFYEHEPSDYKEPLNTTLWIILGVISAFFCCMLGGIITTVYAAKANGNVNSGDIETAKENLKTAKGWFIATVIIGVVTAFLSTLGSLVYSFTL